MDNIYETEMLINGLFVLMAGATRLFWLVSFALQTKPTRCGHRYVTLVSLRSSRSQANIRVSCVKNCPLLWAIFFLASRPGSLLRALTFSTLKQKDRNKRSFCFNGGSDEALLARKLCPSDKANSLRSPLCNACFASFLSLTS